MRLFRALAAAVLTLSLGGGAAEAQSWTAAWASAQMRVEGDNALPAAGEPVTVRQVVRVTLAGSRIRLRLSNRYGADPLIFGGVHAALADPAGPSAIQARTDRAVTFGGRPDAVIPSGADYLSDPVDLPVVAGADVSISLLLPDGASVRTGHPGSRSTSFIQVGDRLAEAHLADAATAARWWALAAVEVETATPARTVVLLGDSITDGYGVAPDTNGRWSDRLAERLRADPGLADVGVINLGIGGNRLLLDGLGPNAMARFDEALAQPGASHIVVLEGVNDLGVLTRDAPASPEAHAAMVQTIQAAYGQMATRAHARGVTIIGATIMPFAGSGYYHPGSETEADRQAINAWIRAPGHFDAVIDFDRLMADPAHPERLDSAYDSGDGLHPSPAGYRFMGDAAPLDLFGSEP